MATHVKNKNRLSKHLLEMKFMKLSRERMEKEDEDEEGRAMFYNHITDELKSSTSKYILQPSWVICEGLKCGRRSFRGMNPVIERAMLEYDDKTAIKREFKEEDVDVTAEEMAQFRQQESTLIETVAKKFKTINDEPPKKKLKFLKPPAD